MSKANSVYNAIKTDVFNAQYKPNTLITERAIVEQYNVSRLTAREALQRLCADGHLISYPRSGYMISVLSAAELEQIRLLRNTIEPLTVELACKEASGAEIRALREKIENSDDKASNASNREFHLALAGLTKNRFIYSFTDDLLGTLSRVDYSLGKGDTAKWFEYHIAIVDAMEARDVPLAKELILKDISQS